MSNLSTPEIEDFLATDRHAILATNRRSGGPQLTPVWYLMEEGKIYVSAMVSTAKVHNLRRDPALTLCIDGGREDARYVVIYGTATLIEPGEPLQAEMRRRIIRQYHANEEAAQRYYDMIRDTEAALIVVTPEKVLGHNFN